MAKMFYTLEEAAQKLGQSTDAIKQLADNGKLQVFRDGDKMMFKCTQVDAQSDITPSSTRMGINPLDIGRLGSSSDIDQTGTGITIFDSKQMKPAGDSRGAYSIDSKPDLNLTSSGDAPKSPAQATGKINVFDPNEIQESDSMAVTRADANMRVKDEDLALESVGSGSGLLDLTRETDDTSLGAELLDEIYPTNNAESPDIKMDTAAIGSTGIFDSSQRNKAKLANNSNVGENSGSSFGALSDSRASSNSAVFSSTESSFQASLSDIGAGTAKAAPQSVSSDNTSPSYLQQQASASKVVATATPLQQMATPTEYAEEEDPMGSLLMSGVLACAMAAILVGLFSIIPAIQGIPSQATQLVSDKLPVVFGVLAVLAIILFGLGMVLKSKKSGV